MRKWIQYSFEYSSGSKFTNMCHLHAVKPNHVLDYSEFSDFKGALSRILHAKACSRLLTLRRNAANFPRSRVQLIVRVAPCRGVSQVSLPRPPVPAILSQVVTLRIQSRACTGCTLAVTLHSLPSLHVFTSRCCMRNGKGQQTVWGIGQCAANTHMRLRSITTQETGQDTSAQSAIWTPYTWNFGKIFGHLIVLFKP